jgi:hypothetical protein
VLAKSQGRDREILQLSIYIILDLPLCTITSRNTAHAYNKGYTIKIARNSFSKY